MIGGAKGIGIGIDFGIPNQYCRATSKPYIEKDVLDSLRVVASAYGKSNDDADRSIVKNLVDASNPFVISNAAFKLNSGYGKYEEDFTSWDRIDASTAEISNDGSKIKCINTILNVQYLFNSINKDIPSFKVKISNFTKGNIAYYYRKEDGTEAFLRIEPSPLDKVLELPKSYNTVEGGTDSRGGFYSSNINIGVTIEQIPSFQGAFVTDGIDDLITSTKTVQEMLGESNEITVVSMIHQVKDSANNVSFTNYIRGSANGYFRNIVNNYDKTGIYGYTSSDLMGLSVVNNILGDKNDYTSNGDNRDSIINGNFSVQGYSYNDGNNTGDFSSVAWYWTVIANKVLTTDQINQVIAYFNLDRTLKPDILCNTIKQGITNENHAEFGDKLIDYSGNGRDIQLNNIAWDGDSGIGKYNYPNWKVTATIANTHSTIVNYPTVNGTYSINVNGVSELMQSIGLHLEIKYTTSTGIIYNDIKQDGVYSYILPDGATVLTLRFGGIPGIVNEPCNITITQIPSHAGALCLDGVNDFGKVTGMPVYKDYTVVTDREIFANTGAISSKNNPGAFVETAGNSVYSFGQATSGLNFISTRSISYLSKYSYCGQSITAGAAEDGTDMWLGTIRDNDTRFFNGAIYSLMSFPYSMSKFLIERQLKKHKLGTLYPNQVEFRPVIPEDENITRIDYFVVNSGTWTVIKPGDYVDVGARIVINVYTKFPYKVEKVSSLAFTGISVGPSTKLNVFDVKGYIKDKTPQKIKLTLAVNEDIVQWNPIITANANYKIHYYLIDSNNVWESIKTGDYITIGAKLAFQITFDNDASELKEVVSPQLSGIIVEKRLSASGYNIYSTITSESPQKINITIDEYIRYEDIKQPYPVVLQIKDRNTNQIYSWGDKIKVGSSIQLNQGENPNLLLGLYSIQSYEYEGETYTYNQLKALVIIITKSGIQFSCNKVWTFDNNEPKCILSPSRLRIPNSSYKLLGYIPDISGHGNHGVIHNSAYAEGSGVNEDGSYQFDGVDDFVTIPTLSSGGKQMLMKVNWNSLNHVLYDQRNNAEAPFCIVTASGSIAYNQRNVGGNTYIDGILNNHILVADLQAITHNIVLNNDYNVANSNSFIGTNYTKSIYAKMSLYDFMLFDNISTDDKIKELNEYVGIEGDVWGILTKLSNSTLISNETLIKNE